MCPPTHEERTLTAGGKLHSSTATLATKGIDACIPLQSLRSGLQNCRWHSSPTANSCPCRWTCHKSRLTGRCIGRVAYASCNVHDCLGNVSHSGRRTMVYMEGMEKIIELTGCHIHIVELHPTLMRSRHACNVYLFIYRVLVQSQPTILVSYREAHQSSPYPLLLLLLQMLKQPRHLIRVILSTSPAKHIPRKALIMPPIIILRQRKVLQPNQEICRKR